MRSLILTVVFATFLAMGYRAPFVFGLGYIWIDLMTPQTLAYSLLSQWPVSLLMGGAAVFSILFVPEDSRPRLPKQSWLILVLALWMALSLLWSIAPEEIAYSKWDLSIKTLVFCALMPALLRTRLHLEAALWVTAISASSHAIAAGVKTAFGGGGYGRSLGLIEGNSLFGEGSTLAMVAVMLIPILSYLGRHNSLLSGPQFCRWGTWVASALCVLTAVGTQARTGLVCLIVLALLWICSSRRVLRNLLTVLLVSLPVLFFSSEAWFARMATTSDVNEHSSMARVAVWKWVVDYVSVHPYGGGFNMYFTNQDAGIGLSDGSYLAAARLSYHSLYFEILGEGGFPALALFFSIMAAAFFGLHSLGSKLKLRLDQDVGNRPEQSADLALTIALRNSLLIFLAGGAFINVGWRSMCYLLVSFAAVLISIDRASFFASTKRLADASARRARWGGVHGR